MIHVTHTRPDGTPARACCEYCTNDPWQPSPFATDEELMSSFQAYMRLHNRKRILPQYAPEFGAEFGGTPAPGAYTPGSRSAAGH
jgi:hypothetical protein